MAFNQSSVGYTQQPYYQQQPQHVYTKSQNINNCVNGMTSIVFLALLIIGAAAASGNLTGIVAGGLAVGIAVSMIMIAITRGVSSSKPLDRTTATNIAIMGLALCIIGSLGCYGFIMASSVGWAMLTPVIVGFAISSCAIYCCCCCGVSAVAGATFGSTFLARRPN